MHYEMFCELWVSLLKEIESFPYPKVNKLQAFDFHAI